MVQKISTYQSGLALNKMVPLSGVFPSASFDSGGLPYGCIRSFASAYVPFHALHADGQAVAIDGSTEALFSLLSNTFGGNGADTFAMPDLDRRAAMGEGEGPGLTEIVLGQRTGQANAALTQDNLPAGLGGASVPFDEDQPSLGIRYLIRIQGSFSSPGISSDFGSMGMVVEWASALLPAGYMECAGQLLSIGENDALFQIIGTTFGGDGISTFALPDLRGRTIIGTGAADPIGATSGTGAVTLEVGQMPVEMGGGGLAGVNGDPSLALSYIICLSGIYPSEGTLDYQTPVIGEVSAFAGNFAPKGWALCQGQLLAINQNQALFSLLGTTYGGNGQTTFALPDLRGRGILGAGQGLEVGTTMGSDGFSVTLNHVPGLDHGGTVGDDFLYGGNAGDKLSGYGGNDTIRAWNGDDTLVGGNGRDSLSGGQGGDFLLGGPGDDTLNAGGGDDALAGGAGKNRLAGGPGADRFVFADAEAGFQLIDRIVDWSAGEGDRLRVDASAFGGGLAAGPLSPDRLVVGAGAAANGAFGQLVFDTTSGRLYFDANGTAAGGIRGLATLAASGLTITDFDIVA